MSKKDVLLRFRNFQEARDARRAKLPQAVQDVLGKIRLENLTNDSGSTDYTLWVDSEIGGWWGVTAQDFAYSLRQVPSDAALTVMIDSRGGSIFEATPMYNLLKQHKGPTTANIYGMAASAASFIAMAANSVVMARNGRMMIHDGQGEVYAYGDEATMRDHVDDVTELADLLGSLSNTIADMYMQKAGGTVAEWRDQMRKTTWYDSSEALAAGLIDEIEGGAPGTSATDQLDLELFSLKGILEPANSNSPAPFQGYDLGGLRDSLKGMFSGS